jgi:RNA polymerase sigma-70 factor (ECF subfamily)
MAALPPQKTVQQSTEEDSGLLHRVQAGDAAAFEELFRRHGARVLRQALSLLGHETEAEEVTQEVFLTLYEKANTLRGDADFTTWLSRLTVHAALSRLRHHTRRPEVSREDYLPQFRDDGHHLVRPVVDWSQDVERCYATAELRQVLQRAIETLAPLDRAVLVLSDFEELSNRDIGDVLGLSVPAVKARLHHARLFLRGKLAVTLGHSPT